MFRVLSLDGGGIRGAYIAACLARFERDLRRPISDYFDLIVGTSTGGIIALGLALGESAQSILEFYQLRGGQIFTGREPSSLGFFESICVKAIKRKFPAVDTTALRRSKYPQENLRAALVEFFRERTIGDIRACRVVIPAVDLILGRTVTFKTPHQPDFVRDSSLRAVDVALCTSAAPIYFPQASIRKGTSYADGGLWANNPALVGYVEAIKISEVCRREAIDPSFAQQMCGCFQWVPESRSITRSRKLTTTAWFGGGQEYLRSPAERSRKGLIIRLNISWGPGAIGALTLRCRATRGR